MVSHLFLALERKVGSIVSHLVALLFALAVFACFWQVVSRFVLESPAVWTEIAVRTLLIWSVFLAISLAIRRGALISVDLLQQFVSGQNKTRLRLGIAAIQIVFLAFLLYVGIQMAWVTRHQTMVALDIPMTYAYAAIPVGALLSILATFAHFLDPGNTELENTP